MPDFEYWIVEYGGQRFRWLGFPLVPGLHFVKDVIKDGLDPKETSLHRFHIWWNHQKQIA